ncbi:hypothetical protein BGX28_005270 [Mortierella sp. GBA30]|nr:hypothetical protein BGX28_005270 [Mortierella sp. GBA30]
MDAKKRPNEDQPDSGSAPVTAGAPMEMESSASNMIDTAEQMEVDPIRTELPTTHALTISATSAPSTAADNGSVSGEANKRIRLTMEADQHAANYSPSIDLADPSKETKGLAEWVGQMGDGGANKEAAPGIAGLGLSDSTSAQDTPAADVSQGDKLPEDPKESRSGHTEEPTSSLSGTTANQDLVNALLEPEPTTSVVKLSDSILAVASLSEPLLTTLNSMGVESQSAGEQTAPLQPRDRPSLTVNPQLSSTVAAKSTSDPHKGIESKKIENEEAAPVKSIVDTGLAESKEQADVPMDVGPSNEPQSSLPESAPQTVDKDVIRTNVEPQPEPEKIASVDQSGVDVVTEAVRDIVKSNGGDGDVTMTIPLPESDASNHEKIAGTQQGDAPVIASEMNHPSVPEMQPVLAKDSMQEQGQEGEQARAQAQAPGQDRVQPLLGAQNQETSIRGSSSELGPAHGDANKAPSQQDLPPISTLSAPISQGARQSRSTMSVSALLVNTDEDSEQEQERSKQLPRSVFDFDSNSRPNQPSSLPSPLAPLQDPTSAVATSIPSTSSHPLRSTLAPGEASRVRDTVEGVPMRHGLFDRDMSEPSHLSGRSQEAILTTYGPNRGTQTKEYPADEVMESGGVSGYSAQRHRLVSPVGIRPMQESVNGQGLSMPMNGRLGSVTSNVSTHGHDTHGINAPMYRSDSSVPGARPSSYSSSQHPGLPHSITTNGHGHYPTSSHLMRPPGTATATITTAQHLQNSAPVIESRHPRLIVKNDASLKMDSRPELFLGYYRYDPGLLLPTMQGNENSLLEVRIASSYLTYDNFKVNRREVWGTDVYTDDSDIVAMLIHAGYYIPPISSNSTEQDSIQPTTQHHNFVPNPIKHICPGFDLAVTLRVLPKLLKYQGSIRHRIKSRTWKTGHDGVSLQIESVRKMSAGEALNRGRSQSKRRMKEYSQERMRVLSNIHDETTESLQNERAMRTATFEFTQQGDPCFKYSPELVMDRHDGLSRKWTSWRLKKEVLILENDEERYEISLQHQAGTDARRFDQYRFAVISPRTSLSSWSKASYPLESGDITEVLYEDLDWQDFEWVERGVVVQPSQRRQGKQDMTNVIVDGATNVAKTSDDGRNIQPSVEGDLKETRAEAATEVMPMDIDVSMAAEGMTQESRQDGVFCVVSRLFWRPRTEQGLPKLLATGSSAPVESTSLKESQKSLMSELQDASLLRVAEKGPNDLTPGVPASQQTALNPDIPPAAVTTIAKTTEAIATPQAQSTSSLPPAESLPNEGSSMPELSALIPRSDSKDAETARNNALENIEEQLTEMKHQEPVLSLTAPAQDAERLEREEGELEDGEIASD